MAALSAFLVVLWIGVWSEVSDCEAKGGKRLRGLMFDGYKCYDASALRVLK